ncbi:glycosyltransferase family 2 protein [Collybiopsis luxurians FD-317 M1]|uniref:Glycosyltransferase family 2 protein n=1 Tax=Collybiopsis luxurians FD-317 M1 TaxID=944289 RepID=A0A0D0C0P3_9AGAR|nr:glycosyltransferase family 2 protein [Collybiopsis luxurians FD-317 M1]
MSPALDHSSELIVITGGHGFIGSHVARHLYETNAGRIRIMDIQTSSDKAACHEIVTGNLCDIDICRKAVRNADIVLHFAANMGGMGTIHEKNDSIIYLENHTMTANLLQASVEAGVKKFLFASSACVYSSSIQMDMTKDVFLKEDNIYPVDPQGLYGLEKLHSEFLILQASKKLDVRIARFHNIYGPGGAFDNGREKAPAALLRKAIARRYATDAGDSLGPFEIWGNGEQRRSFLYIDDAVSAIVKLLESNHSRPVNIGSDASVTIKELADIALRFASFNPADVPFDLDRSKPIGVASRNSNNELAKCSLDWAPTTSLEDGMKLTGWWIREKLDSMLQRTEPHLRFDLLKRKQQSQVIDLASESLVFAILLPITSRGTDLPNQCLDQLQNFAESLGRTTWRDRHVMGGTQYRVKVYLAIDQDDVFLTEGNKAQNVLMDAGVVVARTLICTHPRGHVCKLWRDCARAAWEDKSDFMVLMGDDVLLKDEGWMRDIHKEFLNFSRNGLPFGFGCVAFTDTSFPGMPTFPVIHRTHMEIFNGEVIPSIFINQDGDPFLFQLYRRWGCSSMIASRLSNEVGGETTARYNKEHAQDWTFETLDRAVSTAEHWLQVRGGLNGNAVPPKLLTLDIVIPCYRVDLKILDTILELKTTNSCSTMFIIIIDDPHSPNIATLNQRYAHRPDIRIRVNPVNSGASFSRNRGIQESAADWIHFLDDDIVPSPDLLRQAERVIRKNPNAAGLVGKTLFPVADSIFTTALHLSGVTYFWDIASKIDTDIPWGVTANLIARRNVRDGVIFDLIFPKTGGGEDIDFCRRKRSYSVQHGGEGFMAAPEVLVTHPWWKNGERSYWRFYMWSVGDGALVKLYPENCYRVWVPNSAEAMLSWVCIGLVSTFIKGECAWFALRGFLFTILANALHDCYRHLLRNADRCQGINSSVKRLSWIIAVIESSIIRMISEMGRLRGMLGRKEFNHLGRRFDWFTGRWGDGPRKEEVKNGNERFVLMIAIMLISMLYM